MSNFEVARAHVTVEARDKAVSDAFDDIQRRLKKLESTFVTSNKNIEKSSKSSQASIVELAQKVDTVRDRINRLNREGKLNPEVSRKALADIDKLTKSLKGLNDKDIKVRASLVGNIDQELRDLEKGIRHIDGQKIVISAELRDTKALVSLKALDMAVDALDNRKINLKVDPDGRAYNGLLRFVLGFKALGDVIKIIKFPAIIAGIGELGAAVKQLGGGAITIVAPLQSMLGEVFAIGNAVGRAAPVVASLAAGFLSLAAAVGPVAVSLGNAVTQTSKVAQLIIANKGLSGAELKSNIQQINRAMAQLTQSQRQMVPLMVQAYNALQSFQDALGPAQLKIWKNLLVAGIGTLENLRGVIVESSNAVADLTHNLAGLIGTPRFQAFFRDLVTNGQSLVKILGPALLNGLDTFRAIIHAALPESSLLAKAIASVVAQFHDFVTEAERSGALQKFFKNAYEQASLLVRTFENFAAGLFDIFKNGNDLATTFNTTLYDLSVRFRDFMDRVQKSGDLHKWVSESMTDFNRLVKTVYLLGSVLVGVLRAALGPGNQLYGEFNGWLEKIADNVNSLAGQNKLRKFFEGTIPITKEFLGLALDVVKAFINLGGGEGSANFLRLLQYLRSDVLPALVKLIDNTTKALAGPLLAGIVQLADALASV
jgi:hypothetical protein